MVFSFLGGKGDAGRGAQAAAKFRQLPAVRAYWEGLREAGGGIPARAEIDPRGLASALDCVFVGERIGNGLIRLRISGMSLTDVAGLDMKGLPISTLFIPEARLRLAQVIERVFTLPQVAELHLEAERSIGRPDLAARLLLLPLKSNAGAVELVLGCLATEGQIGRAPRRFNILRAIEERIVLPGNPAVVAERESAFAEPPAPAPLPPLRPLRGRPHLRLVHSAD